MANTRSDRLSKLAVKRLLVLTPLPRAAASTRFRLEQFFPALRAAGIEPTLRPFLGDRGFRVLYRPGHAATKAAAAARAVTSRLLDVSRASRFDAVLIHREAALVGPPVLEWLLARAARLPIIYDFDDAVWVPYDSPTYGARLSALLKWPQKTSFTLGVATHVIAGNPHLQQYARRFNEQVTVIPTVVDTDVFAPRVRTNAVPVLGWIGTHSSARYLRNLVPALQRLARTHRFVVHVHGAEIDAPGVPLENRPWSLEREVDDFQSLDIGLYPLVEEDWSLGKSGFKAVQYMACGTPVVASPVGVTRDIIDTGRNGFLAATEDEWVGTLSALLDDASLRARIGAAARADAVARWSLARHRDAFVDIVASAMRP